MGAIYLFEYILSIAVLKSKFKQSKNSLCKNTRALSKQSDIEPIAGLPKKDNFPTA